MKGIVCCLISVLFAAGCAKKEAAGEARAETKTETAWKVGLNTNGEPVVTLDAETQKRIGLAVMPITMSPLSEELKAYGYVLDPAPLAESVNTLESARAAAKASAQELARLKGLAGQNNASARALETAEAVAARDQFAAEAAHTKLLAWGKAISERSDLSAFTKSLIQGETVLVRVELPAGETLKATPVRAKLFALANEEYGLAADFIGAAPDVNPQTQGLGFFFHAKAAGIVPGAAITAHLEMPGKPVAAAIVPRDAVLWHDGATWIFLQTSETDFARRGIILEQPAHSGWFVRENFQPQDKVVTVGAQTLLSAELSAKGFQSGDRE